jgi:hypothetical protein
MQDVYSGDYSRPELQVVDAALMFQGHDRGLYARIGVNRRLDSES